MAVIAQTLLLLWILGAHAAGAHALAALWLPDERLSRRLLAAGVLFAALLAAATQSLILLHLFRPLPAGLAALPSAAVAVWVFRRRGRPRALKDDAAGTVDAARRLFALPGGWFFWIAGALWTFLGLRAILSPPLAWDSLYFHMLASGEFVQEGGLFTLGFPGTLSFQAAHPRLFESLVAVLMLPFHADTLANLANFFSGGLALLAFWVAGGALGVEERRLKAGMALASCLPAFAAYWSTQYVDPSAAALALAGTALLAARFSGGSKAMAPIGLLALSLGFGMKPYGVTPLAVGAVLAFGFEAVKRTLTPRRAAVLLLAVCAGLPHYAGMAARHGNPFYPFPLEVMGQPIGEGHPGMVRYIEEAAGREAQWFAANHPGTEPSRLRGAAYSVQKVFAQSSMTLGPAPLLLGLLGLGVLCRMKNRWLAALVALNILAAWAAFLNPAVEGLRLYYTVSYARILVFPSFLCLLAGVGALARFRVADLLLWVFALSGLVQLFPQSLLPADWVLLGGALALFTALAAFIRWRLHDGLAFLLAAAVLAMPVVQNFRGQFRQDYWTRSFDLFPLSQQIMPLAPELDRPEGMRLAVAFGEDLWGADWAFYYPLMGSRLQNTLHYVPVTRSGAVVDAPAPAGGADEADPAAWFRRLRDQRIDAVVLARPWTVEHDWILKSRGLFTVIALTDQYAAFEVQKH